MKKAMRKALISQFSTCLSCVLLSNIGNFSTNDMKLNFLTGLSTLTTIIISPLIVTYVLIFNIILN